MTSSSAAAALSATKFHGSDSARAEPAPLQRQQRRRERKGQKERLGHRQREEVAGRKEREVEHGAPRVLGAGAAAGRHRAEEEESGQERGVGENHPAEREI